MCGRSTSIAARFFSTCFGRTWCRSTQRNDGNGSSSTKQHLTCFVILRSHQVLFFGQMISTLCCTASTASRKTVHTSACRSRKTSAPAAKILCQSLTGNLAKECQIKISSGVAWKLHAGDFLVTRRSTVSVYDYMLFDWVVNSFTRFWHDSPFSRTRKDVLDESKIHCHQANLFPIATISWFTPAHQRA